MGLNEAETRAYLVQRLAKNPADLRKANGGRWSKEELASNHSQRRVTHYGWNAEYLTARIKKAGREDILERMKIGDFKSVRAAAIEAGIIKPETSLTVLRKAWKKATEEERSIFKVEINSD